jgi:hypothetical protein
MIDPKLLDLCIRVPYFAGESTLLRRSVDFVAEAEDGAVLVVYSGWWGNEDMGLVPGEDFNQGYGRLRELSPDEGSGWGLDHAEGLYTISPADTEEEGAFSLATRQWTLLNRAVYLGSLRRVFGRTPFDLEPWTDRISSEPVPSIWPAPREVATVDALDLETDTVIDRLGVGADGGAVVRNGLPFFRTCAEQWAILRPRPAPLAYAQSIAAMSHANLAFVNPEGMISGKALEAVVQAQPLGLMATAQR